MKPILLGCAFISAAFASPAAAGKQDFTILNNTGYQIDQIYVAASSTDDWEEDVLGKQVLEDGERFKLSFDRSEDKCLWDIKVDYQDGDSAEWNGIDLCEVSVVSLRYDAKSGKTWATQE